MIFCSSCLRVSPPTDRSEKQVETEEEVKIENDKENGNQEDDNLITKGNGVSNNNENGNDETALEVAESQELVNTDKN